MEGKKTKMKTWKKVVLISLGVIFVAIIALVVWQWNNFKAFYYFATIDTKEEIVQKIDEQKKEREQIVSDYIEGTVRDFTEEEEKKISDGEMTVEEATKLITDDFKTSAREANDSGKNKTSSVSPAKKKELDDFIASNIIQLYSYKAYYLGQLGQIEKSAKADYIALPNKDRTLVSKQAIVDKYLGVANALLVECDSKVSSIMSSIEKKLKENNMDTSIVGQIKDSYEEEKALKKAYYMSLLKG